MNHCLSRMFTRTFKLFFMLTCLFGLSASVWADGGEVKERKDIPDKYKWDLSAMYKSDDAWEADMKAAEALLPHLKSFEGKISKSPADFLAYMKAYEEVAKKLDNAYTYAQTSYDSDTRDQKYSGYKDRAQQVYVKFGEATAWATPEMITVPLETYNQWFKANKEAALYAHYLDDILRTKSHTLSPSEERLLALAGNMAAAPGNANVALREADMKFPTIKDEEGKDVQLSESRMAMLFESSNPEVRRNAAMGMLTTYGNFKNTAAALMSGNIQKDVFYATARNYNSALQAALDADNIDTTVYTNLLETVKKNSAPLRKYADVRRRALGLKEIHFYDMFAPLFPDSRQEIPFEQAVTTINTAMAPLGKDYVKTMEDGFNSRWVDVYENKGKRSGAYSTGTYLSHPIMMMSYHETTDDMFTLCHEMGHSMHTWHSMKYQPYIYSNYTIFVAEVASTYNESLLMDYLLKNEKDPKKKLYLVNQYIDQLRGTLITQVIFADFELKMHKAVEAGEALTAEALSEMYLSTLKDYYGDSVVLDPEYGNTWIRIPHFYRNFYVYKYATSIAAAQALSAKLKNSKGAEKEKVRKDYINFLSGGSSDYPVELLKKAGVDMSKPAAIEASMKKFGELVDELEKLLKQTGKI